MQFARPGSSSRLSPTRLCHCSLSSLAGCPTPEEKNKEDEGPALPRRMNRCLSPWELLPPRPPQDDFISPPTRRAASPGWHGAEGHARLMQGPPEGQWQARGRVGCCRAPGRRQSSPGEGPAEEGVRSAPTPCAPRTMTGGSLKSSSLQKTHLEHLCPPPCHHRAGRSTGPCLYPHPPSGVTSLGPGGPHPSPLSSATPGQGHL